MSDEIQIIVEEADPVIVIVQETLIQGGVGDGMIQVKNEEITGITIPTINMAHSPAPGELELYKNGSLLPNSEFTNAGNPITLTTVPIPSDFFKARYKYIP